MNIKDPTVIAGAAIGGVVLLCLGYLGFKGSAPQGKYQFTNTGQALPDADSAARGSIMRPSESDGSQHSDATEYQSAHGSESSIGGKRKSKRKKKRSKRVR